MLNILRFTKKDPYKKLEDDLRARSLYGAIPSDLDWHQKSRLRILRACLAEPIFDVLRDATIQTNCRIFDLEDEKRGEELSYDKDKDPKRLEKINMIEKELVKQKKLKEAYEDDYAKNRDEALARMDRDEIIERLERGNDERNKIDLFDAITSATPELAAKGVKILFELAEGTEECSLRINASAYLAKYFIFKKDYPQFFYLLKSNDRFVKYGAIKGAYNSLKKGLDISSVVEEIKKQQGNSDKDIVSSIHEVLHRYEWEKKNMARQEI